MREKLGGLGRSEKDIGYTQRRCRLSSVQLFLDKGQEYKNMTAILGFRWSFCTAVGDGRCRYGLISVLIRRNIELSLGSSQGM